MVLVREAEKAGDEAVDITPKDFGVRTVAQEYGGGSFTLSGDTVIFSNYNDQRLYKRSINSKGLILVAFILILAHSYLIFSLVISFMSPCLCFYFYRYMSLGFNFSA